MLFRSGPVARVAKDLGIDVYHARCTPEEKLELGAKLKGANGRVAMIGDGVNDMPALAGADISIAVGTAADAARARADAVVTARDPRAILGAIDTARMTRSVIRQNLFWAALYNVLAIPAAAAGLIPPWAAAIGMSVSSLVVILNALRVR